MDIIASKSSTIDDFKKSNKKTRSTQRKNCWGPTSNSCQLGGGLTSNSLSTCPVCLAWIILSYLMPYHFIYSLSLGPCILFYFLEVPSLPLAPHGDHTTNCRNLKDMGSVMQSTILVIYVDFTTTLPDEFISCWRILLIQPDLWYVYKYA